MRSTWWLLTVLLVAGCSKDPDGFADDTGDTEDTDDTATDTTDSETAEPEPAIYNDHTSIKFELAQPVTWVPLAWEQEIFRETFEGYTIIFKIGAEVEGTTDVALTVNSNLEQEPDDDWVQYHTGLEKGGQLDAVMEVKFPMEVTITNVPNGNTTLTMDISQWIGPTIGLPEISKTFDAYIFDTLALGADSEAATFTAPAFEWTWNSGTIDPASWAPFVLITLDFDLNYSAVVNATTYDLFPRSNTTRLAAQDNKTDRLAVDAQVGEAGAEPNQVLFDSVAKGEMRNDLVIVANAQIKLWYENPVYIEYIGNIPFTMTLGDQGKWGLTFQKEAVTHAKQ